jgi:hypothetical protein
MMFFFKHVVNSRSGPVKFFYLVGFWILDFRVIICFFRV